ncbi:DinB family protein [Mariniflexile jejuense]|uniref:DinB family protein n=1 Tax=Mariniflexile jejuense TaxID=1173582 RepID=A0ABW3JGM7_9FLAO
MKITDVKPADYNVFYSTYINKAPKETDLIDAFEKAESVVLQFFKSIPEHKWDYKYATGKWSIKEVFQHIIDTERIFIYRCFRIARHDKTPLAGFEQDDYILPSNAQNKSVKNLLEEYKVVRQNSIVLLKSLSDEDFKFIGISNGANLSALAAAFMILGHETHHIEVLKALYLC